MRCTFTSPAHLHIADTLFNHNSQSDLGRHESWAPTAWRPLPPFCPGLTQPALAISHPPKRWLAAQGMQRTVTQGRVAGRPDPKHACTKLLLTHWCSVSCFQNVLSAKQVSHTWFLFSRFGFEKESQRKHKLGLFYQNWHTMLINKHFMILLSFRIYNLSKNVQADWSFLFFPVPEQGKGANASFQDCH